MDRLYLDKEMICVRGAGDLATGVIQKLARCGYRVCALEIERPTTIRRQVALSSVMYTGEVQVEDIRGRRVDFSMAALERCWLEGVVPVIVDESAATIAQIKPAAVVDAILAKRNTGTFRTMAPITIGLGPGFSAGFDVDLVIETKRGHRLGAMIRSGPALPNTGIPGEIGGQSQLRVIHAPVAGKIRHCAAIGDWVKARQPLLKVDDVTVEAPFEGVVRGLIAEGLWVSAGFKIADLDPRRLDPEEVFGISDKARCLGGAVLEGYLYLKTQRLRSR